MKKISAALKNYIVDAIALIVLGLVMVIWSDSALETIFRWVGIGLIVLGAIKGVSFFVKILSAFLFYKISFKNSITKL